MGLFGANTSFDADIEKATSDTHTNENWSLILDVCDKVSSNPRCAKECLKSIMKRMGHADPHVAMQAITLLDACANNCGKPFHLEIASREFENEFKKLLSKAQPKLSLKMREVLKNWAEKDFKNDPELNLIPSLYMSLRREGFDFNNLNEKPQKSSAKMAVPKDPNVVSSQQEEDDIAKAIEMSLKEASTSPKHQSAANTTASAPTAYPSLYPSFLGSDSLGSTTSTGATSNNSTTSAPEPRKVRALYNFEAAEENELTFFAGEIIHVLDDTDPNWWKGFNQRGDGLFPSNFVTADLSVDPELFDINQQNKTKKTVQFEDDTRELQQKTEAAAAAAANQRIEIDESKIDRLLHLLHEANPEDPSQDSDEMLRLEQEVHQMGPLIDAELERVDSKHAQLTQLSSDLVDAINLYHSLMRDDRAAYDPMTSLPGAIPPGMAPYQVASNPQMIYGGAGYPGSGGSFPPSMPQAFGMPSMPSYPSMGAQATVLAPPSSDGAYAGQTPMHMANAGQPQPQAIPMQFQNGHVGSTQMNGALNALPPHLSGMTGQPLQQPQSQPYSSSQPIQITTAQPQQGYQMLAQPQQQQRQVFAQLPTSNEAANLTNNTQYQPTTPQAQQQFISPQHQQGMPGYLPQPQYNHPLPNGSQMYVPHLAQQPQSGVNNPNNNGLDQFSQLQQQMAAMSIGANQPVTQSFLVQNEPKNNIPVYQQQR